MKRLFRSRRGTTTDNDTAEADLHLEGDLGDLADGENGNDSVGGADETNLAAARYAPPAPRSERASGSVVDESPDSTDSTDEDDAERRNSEHALTEETDSDPADWNDAVVGDDYSAEDFAQEMELLRSEAPSEQRSAWAYLGLLGTMFLGLAVFGYACSDQRTDDVAIDDPVEAMTADQSSRLVFRVDGDVVAVQGSVPDQAAKDQLLGVAQGIYGAGNVVDDLIVDPDTTLESATVRFIGSATLGDGRPKDLESAVTSTFTLANRGFEVTEVETVLAPVSAEAAIVGTGVLLSGVLPDDQSVTDLVAIASEVWGPPNVDSAGLSVGETTWTDGSVRLTGSTTNADERIANFTALVGERIGALVAVDASGLTLVDSAALVAEVQATVDQLVAASPIRFAPDSPVIDSESDALLTEVAAALNEVPAVAFEVVGHTDDVGNDDENLLLSQQRAAAVVERLTELGVDAGRMSSRGEGEANPVADNSTAAGKAANRRIEFVLTGTSSGGT